MTDMTIRDFSTDRHYMFGYNYNGGEPDTMIVERPHEISHGRLHFCFLYGGKSTNEALFPEDIVAVGDIENGTVEVVGWSGKYRILNQERFNKLLESGAVQLSRMDGE